MAWKGQKKRSTWQNKCFWHKVFPIIFCFGFVSSIGVLYPILCPNSSLNGQDRLHLPFSLPLHIGWFAFLQQEGYFVISCFHWKRILAAAFSWTDLQDNKSMKYSLQRTAQEIYLMEQTFLASSLSDPSLLGFVSSISSLFPHPVPMCSLNCLGLRQSAPSLFSPLAYCLVCFFCREDILVSPIHWKRILAAAFSWTDLQDQQEHEI